VLNYLDCLVDFENNILYSVVTYIWAYISMVEFRSPKPTIQVRALVGPQKTANAVFIFGTLRRGYVF
jgi:hypothetical protein